jgi:hypothetical protein
VHICWSDTATAAPPVCCLLLTLFGLLLALIFHSSNDLRIIPALDVLHVHGRRSIVEGVQAHTGHASSLYIPTYCTA